jgi:hypothetical protein
VVASGCKWLQVVASGCKWLQVVASGCKWLQVVASGCTRMQIVVGGCKWLQVFSSFCVWLQMVVCGYGSSCNYMQVTANNCKLSPNCCKMSSVIASFDMFECLEISYVINNLFFCQFCDISWFEVASVAIMYPQAFASFYSCLAWCCSNKVLENFKEMGPYVFECKQIVSISFS